MADGSGSSSARGTTAITVAILLVGLMTALPWIGVGYCLYVGGAACPAVLSPQTIRGPAVASPETSATAPRTTTPRPGIDRQSVPQAAITQGSGNPDYVALVIGNSGYKGRNFLPNPVRDARAVAARLRSLNYTLVTDDTDPTRPADAWLDVGVDKMERALRVFSRQARRAKVALVFYAGHGIENDGKNYLIPVDASLEMGVDIDSETVPFGQVIDKLPPEGISIVIVDACRTSYFPLADKTGKTRSGTAQRGLKVVEPTNRALFAFSAGSGQAAADGEGENSPYTQALLRHMQPETKIQDVFEQVREDFNTVPGPQKPEYRSALGVVTVAFAPELPLPPPGKEFKECDECPVMVVVPKGKFLMGSPKSEEGSTDDERPQHEVTIPADFAVGKFEITFAEYDACVAAGGCSERPGDDGWGRGNRPVINVSHADAKAYIFWLNTKLGRNRGKYRLLSEAEWEYAARAGTTTAYPWGAKASHDFANYGNDECCEGLAQGRDKWVNTSPAGSFPANRFGLHDMHGNVWEWTEDCWNESYNSAPADGRPWTTGDCSRRVLRGGSWYYFPQFLRSALRYGYVSTRLDYGSGFRLARTN
jgi:formylglycine-generating enzyme required for sulfatase activity